MRKSAFSTALIAICAVASAAQVDARPRLLNSTTHGRTLPVSVNHTFAEGKPEESLLYPGRTFAPVALFIGGKHQWPGVYFEAEFYGDQIEIALDDSVNILKLTVDEGSPVFLNRPGKTGHILRNLGPGLHKIRVDKITESQNSAAVFGGFFVEGRPLPTPARRSRQIEFIGDSYTVGYGNMSGKKQCTPEELHDTTDTSQAYGPLTAKAFDADYQINAFSGRGVVRNYDGFIGDPLPALHPYILFDKKDEYKDTNWKPQVIVIGLGGNDFSTPVKPGEKWKDEAALKADYEESFVAFVKTLRAKNPQAFFLLTKYEGPTVAEEVEKVAAQLKASGETRIDTIGLEGFTLNGCDWHLDSHDHKRISEQLTGYFKAHADLWQGQ